MQKINYAQTDGVCGLHLARRTGRLLSGKQSEFMAQTMPLQRLIPALETQAPQLEPGCDGAGVRGLPEYLCGDGARRGPLKSPSLPAPGSRSWPFPVSAPPDSASLTGARRAGTAPTGLSDTGLVSPHGAWPRAHPELSCGDHRGAGQWGGSRGGSANQPQGFGPVPGPRSSASWGAVSPAQGPPPTTAHCLPPVTPHLTCSASGTISQHRSHPL